jgi:catechol 2,3-dioxygenase-like lactoylglutathione lyase family enzyme
LAGRGGAWFAAGSAQVHLGVEPEFRPARKAHPALLVNDLDAMIARCAAAGYPTEADAPIEGCRRVHVFDPFGNRIELIQRAAAPQSGANPSHTARSDVPRADVPHSAARRSEP